MEENNNIITSEKHIKKRHKNIKILITFITLIFLLAGGTFAWYSWNASDIGVDFVINSNIRIAVDGGVDITGKELYPTLDYTDTNYAITKTIKSWLLDPNDANNSTFNLKLNVMGISDNLKNSSFRWRIHKNGELKASGNFASVSTGASINLITNQIATTSKDIYTLYIYIDGSVDNDPSMAGGTYNFRLVAEGANATLVEMYPEPNAPDLVQGLIPVVYNEATSTWIKADATNENNSWYDYTNKKWANAVLVSENGTRYTTTDKTVDISNNIITSTGYLSNNQNVGNSTATSTFTITTGTEAGTLSFDYTVSSYNSFCGKLTVTVNGTTIANGISGEHSKIYSTSVTANTTYTIVITYEKNGSGSFGTADTASISNFLMPTGSTMTITNGDTYYFAEGTVTINRNKIGASFIVENNKFVLQDLISLNANTISSSIVGNYICSDITQTECMTIYKVTEAGTNITKVNEYSNGSIVNGVRTTYQNAEAGTEINDLDILAFYVWIPRYKYKVWNKDKVVGTDSYSAKNKGIDIKFEEETASTGDITCTNYSFAAPSTEIGSPNETCEGSNGQYYTHPAFIFGDDEIRGFWIGKFELSSETPSATNGGGSSTTLSARILPNVNSWRSNTISSFNTVIQNMQATNNVYGLSTDKSIADSHMLTNMEWGAVAYLTNSNYGRCSGGTCTEVTINNCNTYVTGIGGNAINASNSSTTCTTDANKYNGAKGVLASTTGNVYGVYDMSGGAYEYVMGNMSSTADTYTFNNSSAYFSSDWYTSNQKYVNTYANGSTNTDQTAYNRARLGDATGEVVLMASSNGGWYNDSTGFLYSSFPWFARGGNYFVRSNAGIFYFSSTTGYSLDDYSTRATLVSLSN